jgi:hypothetical protein
MYLSEYEHRSEKNGLAGFKSRQDRFVRTRKSYLQTTCHTGANRINPELISAIILLPLDGGGWLVGDVITDAVDAFDLVTHIRTLTISEIVSQAAFL